MDTINGLGAADTDGWHSMRSQIQADRPRWGGRRTETGTSGARGLRSAQAAMQSANCRAGSRRGSSGALLSRDASD